MFKVKEQTEYEENQTTKGDQKEELSQLGQLAPDIFSSRDDDDGLAWKPQASESRLLTSA